MSVATVPQADNILQDAADQLLNNANLPLSKQIFRDAIESVARQQRKADIELLKGLSNIQDLQQLQDKLKKDQQSSKTFTPTASNRFNRRLARISDIVFRAKPYMDAFAQICPKILLPAWGTVLLLATLVHDIPSIESALTELFRLMERYDQTFAAHFMTGHTISNALKSALQSFYVCIVEACLRALAALKISRIRVYFTAHNGHLKSDLEGLVENLKDEARQVYDAAGAETYGRGRAIESALASTSFLSNDRTAPAAPLAAEEFKPIRYISCPQTTHFSGREYVLGMMSAGIRSAPTGQLAEIALWGPPGIGKTQTSLRFEKFTEQGRGTSPAYDHVFLVRARSAPVLATEIRCVVASLDLIPDALLPSVDIKMVNTKFRKWLRNNRKWLLIFDDILLAQDIHDFRPLDGQGHVIYNTRSKEVAYDLCGPEKAIELRPMNVSDTAAFTRSLLSATSDHSLAPDDWSTLTTVAKGLPLAIETLTHYARLEGLSLVKAMDAVKNREILLRQNNDRSFHVDNYSVGAILVQSFEALHRRYPMAAALFELLVYLQPSSIPVPMLRDGASSLQAYFDRHLTYDKGAIRTPEGEAEARNRLANREFSLSDYDPFRLKDWKRMVRFCTSDQRFLHPELPRIDSPSDIQLQEYWQTTSLLKNVFSDPIQLTVTLNQLQDSGLVRRVDINTLWIHDLYAELMVAHITSRMPQRNKQTSHLASAVVFLSLPVVEFRFKTRHACWNLLPHAEAAFAHLKSAGIMADATLGAELAHFIASAIYLRWQLLGNGRVSEQQTVSRDADPELAKVIAYYHLAVNGYYAGWKRLMAHPKINVNPVRMDKAAKGKTKDTSALQKIVIATLYDWEFEVKCQLRGKGRWLYRPDRYCTMFQFERFGSSAPWRAFQTALKLGVAYEDKGDWDQAIQWTRQGTEGIQLLFGRTHIEFDEVTDSLMGMLMRAEKWDEALTLVQLKTDVAVERWGEDWQSGDHCLRAMALLSVKAKCLMSAGSLVQSKWLWLKVWKWRARVYGVQDRALLQVAEELATVCALLGEKVEEVEWWCRVLRVCFANLEGHLPEERARRFVEGLQAAVQVLGEQEGDMPDQVEELIEEMEPQLERWLQDAPERLERARRKTEWTNTPENAVMSDEVKYWLLQGKERGLDLGVL